MAEAALAIDVEGLTKRFDGKVVVDRFGLQVRRGQIYGFLGPNGSGKTTTIRMLCGLLTPDGGRGTCLGFDILRESASIKREVGYMTQRFSLYEDLSIAENLDFIGRIYGLDHRRRRIDEALERLGLEKRRGQLAGLLSGGWKQRLALAASLLHDPKLLLLDEPTAGVDPGARREFWEHLHHLAHGGMTVLVSTHYMDEAERCHALAYIAYGKLLASGTAADVVAGAKLHTWAIEGEGLAAVAEALRGAPGADMVVPFGTRLHVSGTDDASLEASVARATAAAGLRATRIEPGLEDVFIHLMRSAPEPVTAARRAED
ncbi:MAG: ABC transporter ATP-binding protein [Betaproteobacteria bacterium]|nr:ABC transporter ATP-binding protein [Betaproteobacteria bacterium]